MTTLTKIKRNVTEGTKHEEFLVELEWGARGFSIFVRGFRGFAPIVICSTTRGGTRVGRLWKSRDVAHVAWKKPTGSVLSLEKAGRFCASLEKAGEMRPLLRNEKRFRLET